MTEDFDSFRRYLAEELVRIYNITPQELGVIIEIKPKVRKFKRLYGKFTDTQRFLSQFKPDKQK